MPRRQPFTRLCQTAARLAKPGRADLHTHSTASDGDCTPSQLIALAHNERIDAIALTDHDTTNGLTEAQELATRLRIELIPGVEISTRLHDREYHILGLYIDSQSRPLQCGLSQIRQHRRERFDQYLSAFAAGGVRFPPHLLAGLSGDLALGRRHLAKLLVASRHANTVPIAFLKYIHPARVPAMHAVSLPEAIDWIHAAGGLASLAHPPDDLTREQLDQMAKLGLDAVETNCPSVGYEFGLELAAWCDALGMTITAGSDSHGPDGNPLGCRTVSLDQLAKIRKAARRNRD